MLGQCTRVAKIVRLRGTKDYSVADFWHVPLSQFRTDNRLKRDRGKPSNLCEAELLGELI